MRLAVAMRLALLVFVVVLGSCSKSDKRPGTASAASSAGKPDKFVAAEKLATADLASVASSAHVPGAWHAFLYWDSSRKLTLADSRLTFASDPGDPLASAPYLSVDQFQVEIGPPPRVVTHADPDKLRQAAEQAAKVEPALALARAELKALDRYQRWKQEGFSYETTVSVSSANGHVVAVFSPDGVTDNDVRIEVDPVARSVVRRDVHVE